MLRIGPNDSMVTAESGRGDETREQVSSGDGGRRHEIQ